MIVPTGGGKTLIGIMDACKRFESASEPISIIVVAPRLLLANQLCEEYMEVIKDQVSTQVVPAHIHSGDTSHFSTTKAWEIRNFVSMTQAAGLHRIFFTTYHSLHRIAESSVQADTIYFDEAHNSVQKGFYPAVKFFSETTQRAFFFTATPKHSVTPKKPGMNDSSVYGNVIVNVEAGKLVQGGFIVRPQVVARELRLLQKDELTSHRDSEHIIQSIDESRVSKVLVCAKSVKQIVRMVAESSFVNDLKARGFSYMYIAASTGAIINGHKVTREEFFKTLNAWGADNTKQFVVLHHSILSEGINVSGLEAVIMLRAMDAVGVAQTIGRVIRLHKDDAAGLRAGTITPGNTSEYTKSFGLVIVPVFNTTQQGVARSVDKIVDTIFNKGEAAVSVIRR
ncbi:helicase [Synechococcus phage S-CAM7]|uniref:Helicase n=1 Tax=Synechococcus phage S-CAM7 TaxID=1883368 RepID=A0A1D8KTC0_9CAUD|nr:helicase [Synechococcus phage S-CAM7]AOV61948.1 helicase [Synechococcus phage S-CAM7]